jgi:hypothetical protein
MGDVRALFEFGEGREGCEESLIADCSTHE